MNKQISFIIPVYNVEKYLPKLFQSIEEQIYKDFEVIFINDGSTDNSLNLLKEFQHITKYSCIIIDKPNGGLNSARIAGINRAKYDLIISADSDDYFEPDYISNLVKHISDNVDIVFAPIITENNDGSFISILNFSDKDDLWNNKDIILKKILKNYDVGNFFVGKLYKKHLFDHIDFSFNKPFEDYTFQHIVFNNANTIYKISKPSYHYVKHNNTLSNKTLYSYISCIEAILIRRDWVLKNYPNNDDFLLIVDETLLDRFIQTVSSFKVDKKLEIIQTIKQIYRVRKKNNQLNVYLKRNLSFYFKLPNTYLIIKRILEHRK